MIVIAISPSASRRKARDGDPREVQQQWNGPWRLHQVGAGPFADDLELLVLLEDQLHARGINLHILSGICAGLHRPDGAPPR